MQQRMVVVVPTNHYIKSMYADGIFILVYGAYYEYCSTVASLVGLAELKLKKPT